MILLVQCFVVVGGVAAIAWLAGFGLRCLSKPGQTRFLNLVKSIALLPTKEAEARVNRLIEERALSVERAADTDKNLNQSNEFGLEWSKFAIRFQRVAGDEFRFYPAKNIVRVKSQDYLVIGDSGDDGEGGTFLVLANGDNVFVLDDEETDIDPNFRFPTIWHAILFESTFEKPDFE